MNDNNLRFEFENCVGKYNLYERDGDRHIEKNTNFKQHLQAHSGGNSNELGVLYPVAQIKAVSSNVDNFRNAIGEFVSMFKISYGFKFYATKLNAKDTEVNENILSGRVSVKGQGLDWKVDSIEFY